MPFVERWFFSSSFAIRLDLVIRCSMEWHAGCVLHSIINPLRTQTCGHHCTLTEFPFIMSTMKMIVVRMPYCRQN